MATDYSNSNNGYRLRLDVTNRDGNSATNTSVIDYGFYLEQTNKRFNGTVQTGDLSINGVSLYSKPASFNSTLYPLNSAILLKSGSLTVSHDSDGSKTVSLVANYSANSGGFGPVGLAINTTFGLTTIPRASVPTLSNASPVMNTSITISTNRASTSFTHTLKYQFGSYSGTIASGVATSQTWTVPLDFANSIPNSKSGVGTITCETYNGATLIGTKTVSFTASVPTTVVPVINSVTVTDSITNIATQFGAFVQDKSLIKVVTVTSGAYSSTVANDGVQTAIFLDKIYTGKTFTATKPLPMPTNKYIKTYAKDSRGVTVTLDTPITILPYTNPTITRLSAYRANASGGADDNGTSIAVSMKFNVASVNNGTTDKNTKAWTLKYRESGTSTWNALGSGSVYAYDSTFTQTGGLFNADKSYEIQLTVADYFTSVSQIVNIGTTFTLINFNASGRGVAFGKASEISNGFELAMAPTFIGGLPAVSVNGKDMNTVTETGFYYGYNVTNAGANGVISSFMVIKYSADWITQIQFAQEANSRIFIRSRHDGTTWSTWRQI